MTREEAIEMCKSIKEYLTGGNPVWSKKEVAEAMTMAIEALQIDLVRCGECMWQGNKWDNGMVTCENDLGMINAPDDGFCSYGERRNDE